MNRYFLDQHGAKTFRARGQPGEGHVDIGQEVLAELGVTPKDKLDVYEQMFQRKFVRVVEHDDHTLEVEYRGKLTSAQKSFIEDMEQKGCKLKLVKNG